MLARFKWALRCLAWCAFELTPIQIILLGLSRNAAGFSTHALREY